MSEELVRRLVGQLELSALDDLMLEDGMERMIGKTHTRLGAVAGLCVWPNFISLCARRLEGKGVRVLTPVNYPKGGDDVERAIADTEEAIDDGADEIELLFPAGAFLGGEEPLARSMVAEVRDAMPEDGILKVMLDPSAFPDSESLASAARLAIEEGAAFIKAGTGRGPMASEAQLKTLLETIHDEGKGCGLAVVGPFTSLAALRGPFELACRIIGEPWASVDRFRLCVSGDAGPLLKALGAAP